eukprot:CAMPEP_0175129646 /NCGR_PEP_ID=MMETSP0087-20121206/5583_1 /TAXON_ID=136419 /ORGANISM="Unknown Unknown, Strain D1" /LENGTH=167 /DNA_ID=CAMNT_0016411809 /DNA_START=171 /DNA_END=673 /DNA_ORIENTATION=-
MITNTTPNNAKQTGRPANTELLSQKKRQQKKLKVTGPSNKYGVGRFLYQPALNLKLRPDKKRPVMGPHIRPESHQPERQQHRHKRPQHHSSFKLSEVHWNSGAGVEAIGKPRKTFAKRVGVADEDEEWPKTSVKKQLFDKERADPLDIFPSAVTRAELERSTNVLAG